MLHNLCLQETYPDHMQQECLFFFSSRRRHTRWPRDWSSDVCSSDLTGDNGKGPLECLKQLLKRNYLLCQLKAFYVLRAVTSTRNLSSNYLCRIRNVPV